MISPDVKDWGKSRHSEERRGENKIIKEEIYRGKVVILYYYFKKQHTFNSAAYKYFSRDRSNPTLPFHMFRSQFPLNLAFTFTINKAQGQSFEWNGIYLPDHVFSHGQLYVAFSSSEYSSNTKIIVKKKQFRGNKTYTRNTVYKEIL